MTHQVIAYKTNRLARDAYAAITAGAGGTLHSEHTRIKTQIRHTCPRERERETSHAIGQIYRDPAWNLERTPDIPCAGLIVETLP